MNESGLYSKYSGEDSGMPVPESLLVFHALCVLAVLFSLEIQNFHHLICLAKHRVGRELWLWFWFMAFGFN